MAALAGNMVPQPHHHFVRQNLDSADGSVSMDSTDRFDGDSPNLLVTDDNNSCSSDDTVLSVGNENPPPSTPPSTLGTGEPLSFKNIESHLNAISQITNSTLDPNMSRKSPSSPASTKSGPGSPGSVYSSSQFFRPSSGGPESPPENRSPRLVDSFCLNNQNSTKQHHHMMNHHHQSNNDANNASLKFSIDNILKADFGRRITDPINIRKCKPNKKLMAECVSSDEGTNNSKIGPVDLSKSESAAGSVDKTTENKPPILWPAWVYCTRYSDRPSSGRSPRTRRVKKPGVKQGTPSAEEKRPRTAFSGAQLARLKHEFAENRYLTERRRQQLSGELGLNEAQIKIWFQNKRAKIKKASGQKNPLALQLMAQGLYNHSTIPLTKEEEELQEMHATKPTPS